MGDRPDLTGAPGWEYDEDRDAIVREFELKGFNGALQLANVIGWVANQMKHHPEILLHRYNWVSVWSRSHDADRVTEDDVALARAINAVVDSRFG